MSLDEGNSEDNDGCEQHDDCGVTHDDTHSCADSIEGFVNQGQYENEGAQQT